MVRILLTLGNETGKVGNQIRVGTPSGPSSTVRRTIEKIIIHPAFTTTRKDSNIGLFYFRTFTLTLTTSTSPLTKSYLILTRVDLK